MGLKADGIIDGILEKHGVSRDEFHGRKRSRRLLTVRIEVALALQAAKYTVRQIEIHMDRDHGTVGYFLYPKIRESRRNRSRRTWQKYGVLRKFDPDVRAAVLRAAIETDTNPRLILAQWVTERARQGVSP